MNNKPYNLFSSHLKQCFGGRVHKISVDAGFSCPNRGATRDQPGCLFCDPSGSGSAGIEPALSVAEQIQAGKEVMVRKYKAEHFLAYFQPFSNTFAPVDRLRSLYDEALGVEGVVGLAVGTRPDCLPPEVLDLLAEYHRRSYFWLELGLQSIHDQTLNRLRRGHDYDTFVKTYHQAKRRGLRVCVHLILGLPGENREQILASAEEMARLGVDGIKLHLLHVLEGTGLGDLYRQGEMEILSQEDYVSLVVDMVERLSPQTLIHRLTGDGPRDRLLAPLWSLNKWQVLNAIDAEFKHRGTKQGSRFDG
ncbi:TIGR01212 family radical SAM protein [Syntrophotalea acetylenivorans]|uniref:TIGR01212 family radical SAM protein n=1 Tax=Syntrophotalea acetylenivorans TaxID=1842532 RepID=A0A1L3GRL3_9BACT|nr:TIGR01212 family radical SAM protein [Syntrophotalea acetylenivorans]APG28553.1 TIGR01212 family radical SAM protein [Syntrophotalea acetylenivorans]